MHLVCSAAGAQPYTRAEHSAGGCAAGATGPEPHLLLQARTQGPLEPALPERSGLERITKIPVQTVMRENAGHYPMEEPGLQQMHDTIAGFVTKHTA